MSRDNWRFDPNMDYRNYDDDDNRNRGGFKRMKKNKKFKKEKQDGKRYRHDNDDRW